MIDRYREIEKRVECEVSAERIRQDIKWGAPRRHNIFKWMTILMEEVGEASQEAIEGNTIAFAEEMVQVAATAQCILVMLRSEFAGIPEDSIKFDVGEPV